MHLPAGVTYHPREEMPLAKDAPAHVRIDTRQAPNNKNYRINHRTFDEAIKPYRKGDWARLELESSLVAYSRAEHRGHCKLPNLTVVPNLRATRSAGHTTPLTVFGSTMGHFHPPATAGRRVQEIYEFQTHGMMVLDSEDGAPTLWVAGPGDKVAVPSGCHMTLYNLGGERSPLVTLDFANPDRNPTNRDQVSDFGPILLGTYDDLEVTFTLSDLYINNPGHNAGVRLPAPPRTRHEREVRIALGARMALGRLLCDALTRPDVVGQLARLGLQVRRATNEAVLEPLPQHMPGRRLHIALPLVESIHRRKARPDAGRPTTGYDVSTPAYAYFFPDDVADTGHPPGKDGGIVRASRESATRKRKLVQVKPATGRLNILVEGVGDWVKQAYLDMLRARQDRLAVAFADDGNWLHEQPSWTQKNDPCYEPWMVYYDKANPDHRRIYEGCNPDVVFVITPDFTHSAIARQWVGLSPLVLVEKPFDSDLTSVDELLGTLAQQRTTAVLGLDHYQMYALGIHRLMPDIMKHLGGSLTKVDFRMTESRPIELGRQRSLQHGLTLDLLPHLPALLTFFGDVATIDDIQVDYAGQYRPLVAQAREADAKQDLTHQFRTETASRLRFTFQDYSGNGFHVPCDAVVGKGFEKDVKYFEVHGPTGNAIRIDFNRRPTKEPVSPYPWDKLFFIQGEGRTHFEGVRFEDVQDPYDAARTLRILHDDRAEKRFSQPVDRGRYERLLDALIRGTDTPDDVEAIAGILHLHEARAIVRALDRIWNAVQATRPWGEYGLYELDPTGR